MATNVRAAAAVQFVLITVRNPDESTGDPWQCDEGWFVLDGGKVFLTDRKGKPIEDVEPETVDDPQYARATAARMLRDRWASKRGGFNRKLKYRSTVMY